MAKLEMTRKMLKPSIPTPDHLRTLNLSFFDQIVPRAYVPVLFHYLPSSTTQGTVCDKLQKSLAQTLTKFYPLAGRFNEDEFSIHCNDEGVEYVQTKVNAQLAQFLHQGTKTELLNDFLPWPSAVPPYSHLPSSPLLGVQVNLFHCGGLVIAIQISHIVADAFTLATFVKEWAHICQTGTTKADGLPISFGPLPSLFPKRELSGTQYSPPSNRSGSKSITRRFVFDALAISKLKNTIEDSSAIKPTRVVVVMSLLWKVLVGISTAKNGHSRDSSFLFPINLRGKSTLPSLEHALGNCTMFGSADLEARKELNDLVGKTIRDTCVGIRKAESVDDVFSLVVNNQVKIVDMLRQGEEMDIYSCSSWCGFPWYEADFGWGKPFWVSSVCFDAIEIIILMDTKDGDGIEAWVSLMENDMAEFERDADISTFCSPFPE